MAITQRYIELKVASPSSEFSQEFLQGMLDRMAMSFHKYGKVKDAYPFSVDAIKSLRGRLGKYDETGNTEYLMDAANFAMIEFMHPARVDAYFKATDADGSPGRHSVLGNRSTQEDNKELKSGWR